jgi:uncharacterized protein YgbK (DUF1537 family)
LRIGVIADDLTGALDTGVQFRNWGLEVDSFIGNLPHGGSRRADVIVIDTETRNVNPSEAYERVNESTLNLKNLGAQCFYKKIDSTLRGNIGTEIDAIMEASKAEVVFFIPAYPMYGRTVVNGEMLVSGIPLDKTEYGGELCKRTSKIADIIACQGHRCIGHLNLEVIEKGSNAIKERVQELRKQGVEIIIFDSRTEKHLSDAAKASDDVRVFVGSAGFASEVPVALGLKEPKPVLSVCGSTRAISRRQTEALRKRLAFAEIEVNVDQIISSEYEAGGEIRRCFETSVDAIKSGADVSIVTTPTEVSMKSCSPNYYLDKTHVHSRVEEALGDIVSFILKEVNLKGMILTGGATSLKVCEKLGHTKSSIMEELAPGIPMIMLGDGMIAVTKAGGFGVEDSLVQAAQKLRRVIS